MARTALTPVVSTRAGVALTFGAANADGHSLANAENEALLIVTNGSASPITVTIPIPKTVDGKAIASLEVAVAAGATKVIGPFPKGLYNQTGDVVHINFSDVTTVTVAAIELGSDAY